MQLPQLRSRFWLAMPLLTLFIALTAHPQQPLPPQAMAGAATETAKADPQLAPPLPKIPENRLVLNDLTIFRYNPIGLETQVRFGWQHKLYDADNTPIRRDNFLFAGTFLRLNPASLRAAGMVEVQPFTLINLRFTAEYIHYYGNYTFIQSRPSATSDLSDKSMKAEAKGPLGNYAGGGFHATFEPLFQVKAGPIALRNRALFGWFDMNLQRGDRVWYEATLDTAIPAKGLVFANDLDLLYQLKLGTTSTLNLGTRYSVVEPLYSSEQILPTESLTNVNNGHQRLGLIAAYTLYDDGYTSFNKPTIVLISSWYLQHRYRTGADTSQALPYIVLGFAFQSDFLGGQ